MMFPTKHRRSRRGRWNGYCDCGIPVISPDRFDHLRSHIFAVDCLLDDNEESLSTALLLPELADSALLVGVRALRRQSAFVLDHQQATIAYTTAFTLPFILDS